MAEPLYVHTPEIWDEAKCARIVRHTPRNLFGPTAPFKGYIGSDHSMPPAYGSVRYNGVVIRDGQWYSGEFRPFPIIPDDYEIVYIISWGWRLKRKDDTSGLYTGRVPKNEDDHYGI